MAQITLKPLLSKDIHQERPLTIAGPCSAESEQQLMATALLVAQQKVQVLRAGVWKPRTRPGTFEGVGTVGLKWLQKAKEATGLLTSVEVANASHAKEALEHGIDILWIGARTTVNPFAVQEIADAIKGVDVPVLVKNPVNPDLELWMGALERFNKVGIERLGAIHRGFSSHAKTPFRNVPQWQLAIELKRRLPELPIICDPSHICGNTHMIPEVSQKAMDLNFEGLMIETHHNPKVALSDAKQQVTPDQLGEILSGLILRKATSKDENFQHVLDELRSQIDQYDEELFDILSQRMAVAEKIGEYKRENNVTIYQTARWNEILETSTSKAEKLGLSSGFVMTILNAIHQESINKQTEIMKQKEALT
jgi:3-deoxy-7-phosphoheptulonate synthase